MPSAQDSNTDGHLLLTWNGVTVAIPPYIVNLEAQAPSMSRNTNTLFRYGTLSERTSTAVVCASHGLLMFTSLLEDRFNFRNPAPNTEAAYDELYTRIVIEPTFERQMLAFGIATAAFDGTDPAAVAPVAPIRIILAPDLPVAVAKRFTIGPERIKVADDNLLEEMLLTISCRSTATSLRAKAKGSARRFVIELITRCDQASVDFGGAYVAKLKEHESRGITDATVKSFNEFESTFRLLNDSIPANLRQPADCVDTRLIHHTRKLGQHVDTKLDVQLLKLHAADPPTSSTTSKPQALRGWRL